MNKKTVTRNNNKIEESTEITVEIRKKSSLLPWSEKYRPDNIDKILFHDKIKNAITNYMKNKKLPHLLLYGPPGTGKTSSIIAFARHYYKKDFDNMILILNASEERGIETVRNRIKQFVMSKGLQEDEDTPPFKMIILDEIDAMTEDAQAILRKVIEKYVSNVRFCFICNYLKKINPAIQSRCVIFRFNPISYECMYRYITNICENENINITKKAFHLIIKKSNGDLRKLLNILQSLYMHNYMSDIVNNKVRKDSVVVINETSVSKLLSCPSDNNIKELLKYFSNNTLEESYKYLLTLINKNGISLQELISYIYEFFMEHICNDGSERVEGNILSTNSDEELERIIDLYDKNKIMNIINKLAIINENITYCNNENVQIVSFLAIFYM